MESTHLTLYELNTGCDEFGNFIKLVAKLMATEYIVVEVNKEKDENLLRKSFTGRFPVLELEDKKTCFCEPLAISKYLANDRHGFYGPDPIEKAKIDQWLDIIQLTIAPLANSLIRQVAGQEESEIRAFSQRCTALREALMPFEKHLKLRNYLSGYSLTLADAYLVTTLLSPFQLIIDKKSRD